jgi:hypothetical protein
MADVATGNLSNATAIGYLALATASNQVRIGNDSVTSIEFFVDWSIVSDKRIKKNIQANVPGLPFINQLQPVTYNLDLAAANRIVRAGKEEASANKVAPANDSPAERIVHSGFLAQDVEKTAQSIGYDFSGVDADKTGKSLYGLRYAEFVVPLVKAIQELGERNKAKEATIALLQSQLTALDKLITQLDEQEGIK